MLETRTETDPLFCGMKTQTQIIGAGLACDPWPKSHSSLLYQIKYSDAANIRCQPSEAELTKAAEEILSWVAFKETDGHWWGYDTDCGNPVPEVVDILKRLLRGEA